MQWLAVCGCGGGTSTVIVKPKPFPYPLTASQASKIVIPNFCTLSPTGTGEHSIQTNLDWATTWKSMSTVWVETVSGTYAAPTRVIGTSDDALRTLSALARMSTVLRVRNTDPGGVYRSVSSLPELLFLAEQPAPVVSDTTTETVPASQAASVPWVPIAVIGGIGMLLVVAPRWKRVH